MKKECYKAYVSGALTGLSKDSNMKEFYERIAETVDSVLGIGTAYVPHKHTDPVKDPDVTPEEVYRVDKKRVCESDLVIAYVGTPSLGVGAELEMANSHNIPILLLYRNGEIVSRLPRGMESVKGLFEYDNEEEALNWIENKLKELLTK